MSKNSRTAVQRTGSVSGSERGQRARGRRMNTVLLVVGLLFTAFISFLSHEWGATWHSIVGIGALGVIAWHVYSQRRWVRSATSKRMAHAERRLVIFNTVLAATFIIAILSGFPVWLAGAGGLIESVHSISGTVFLPVAIGHLFLNRRRISVKLRRRPVTA
ncbi:hypothetical protein [Pseudonocardia aurantiaca]|uniref:DUF4405 domain-containing protein n=1 Tax=Pseudonocardia aurantiaca TaxID=75290 RepID=A0ABW4FMT9_9PSEU